jgi:hypothetical protein
MNETESAYRKNVHLEEENAYKKFKKDKFKKKMKGFFSWI